MNIYDACNVKGLLAGYMLSALGKYCPERTAELLDIEAAIRSHVIREASAGLLIIPELMTDEPIVLQTVFKSFPAGTYHLVRTEDAPLFAGLLATPEEIAAMKKETP